MAEERLQKILAKCGYGSRRESEKLISSGRVEVNRKVAKLGDKGDLDRDQILIDKRPILKKIQENIYIAFHKPKYVLSETKKSRDRKTITDYVKIDIPLQIVGRLDYESEGLILLTNNGELTNKLTHPRYEHDKEYHVLLSKKPDEKQLEIWRRGVVLDNAYRTLPANIKVLKQENNGTWVKVILKEGKKRQIRETGRTIGLPVKRIIRKRIGLIEIGNLQPGHWRYLEKKEVNALLESIADK